MVVLAINRTITWWVSRGLPRQFWVMKANSRCSIRFHLTRLFGLRPLLAPGWPHGLSCPLGHGGLSVCKIVLDPVDCLAGLASSAGDGVSSDLLNPSPSPAGARAIRRLGEGIF